MNYNCKDKSSRKVNKKLSIESFHFIKRLVKNNLIGYTSVRFLYS